ncbi:hypothetical protein [Rubripirellula reticaptiva]|uniref:Uncharacterized protein n=1 Tax=Rubripirellula reticaptiva TaxID=2528013 RepID=A0A5C6EIJ4_9BACT|nr:hypothetical protein [Rubripirellula reticaptiva]TWU48275.1 hypothetical protein Poly59_51210 [Rubripirellula reticaptiva]
MSIRFYARLFVAASVGIVSMGIADARDPSNRYRGFGRSTVSRSSTPRSTTPIAQNIPSQAMAAPSIGTSILDSPERLTKTYGPSILVRDTQ